MLHDIDNDFQTTMLALEKGLQVQHIATFPFTECKYDDDIAHILTDQSLLSFDHIPIRRGNSIIGILEREKVSAASGKVEKYMTPLADSMLTAAETPLMDFIIGDAIYRLVLRGSKIDGIITRSDLLKLPVRLLAFSLVTHVEALLSQVIRAEITNTDTLLAYLPDAKQEPISKKLNKLKKQNQEIDLVELIYLSDKRTIVEKLNIFDRNKLSELEEINRLRNTVAHQHNYTESEHRVQEFITRLRLAHKWIDLLLKKE